MLLTTKHVVKSFFFSPHGSKKKILSGLNNQKKWTLKEIILFLKHLFDFKGISFSCNLLNKNYLSKLHTFSPFLAHFDNIEPNSKLSFGYLEDPSIFTKIQILKRLFKSLPIASIPPSSSSFSRFKLVQVDFALKCK